MNLFSTFAIFAIAVQCAAASSERKLLRSGYDSPVDFSTLTGGNKATQQDTDAALPGLPGFDSVTKGLSGVTGGKDSLSSLLPGGLPSTDALSSITKGGNVLPTDLSSLTKGGALSSITGGSTGGLGSITNGITKAGGGLDSITKGFGLDSITSGATKAGSLPSLPGLPVGGAGATKGFSGITDTLSGVTDGLKLPSTASTTSGDKNAYALDSK